MHKIKILVVSPSWIGDIVMSHALIRIIYKQYQDLYDDVVIDVLTPKIACSLVTRMQEVRKALNNPFAHGELSLLKRWHYGKTLRQENYNVAFILPNSFKSALIPFFAKIKVRIGFVGEIRYGLINHCYTLNKAQLPKMIDRYIALSNKGVKVPMQQIMLPQLITHSKQQQHLVKRFNLNCQLPLIEKTLPQGQLTSQDTNKAQNTTISPIIAFCPSAEYGPAKRWPVEHFAKLAVELTLQLAPIRPQIIILGGSNDAAIAAKIMNISHELAAHYSQLSLLMFNLCGQTSLGDVVDLLGLTHVTITNDSGLMHVACATLTSKVIAIYGSSSATFTPPLKQDAIIMQTQLFCQPCFARTCRFGHYQCLYNVTPETVATQTVNYIAHNLLK